MKRQPMTTVDSALDAAQVVASQIDPNGLQHKKLLGKFYSIPGIRSCGGVRIMCTARTHGWQAARLLLKLTAESVIAIKGYVPARTDFGAVTVLNDELAPGMREKAFYFILTQRVIPRLLEMQRDERMTPASTGLVHATT